MRLATNGEFDLAAEVGGIVGVRSDKADELVTIVMHVLGEDGVAIRYVVVPRRVHLESTWHDLAVDPADALSKLIVDLLERSVHHRRPCRILHDICCIRSRLIVHEGHARVPSPSITMRIVYLFNQVIGIIRGT